MSLTLSGLFLIGALNRPRKRRRTNRENPRTIPEQVGKTPKNRESPKKDKKGRTSPAGSKKITHSLFKLSAYKMGVSMRLFKLQFLSLFNLPFSISKKIGA